MGINDCYLPLCLQAICYTAIINKNKVLPTLLVSSGSCSNHSDLPSSTNDGIFHGYWFSLVVRKGCGLCYSNSGRQYASRENKDNIKHRLSSLGQLCLPKCTEEYSFSGLCFLLCQIGGLTGQGLVKLRKQNG